MWKRFKLIMQYLWKNYKKMNGLADQFTKVEKKTLDDIFTAFYKIGLPFELYCNSRKCKSGCTL